MVRGNPGREDLSASHRSVRGNRDPESVAAGGKESVESLDTAFDFAQESATHIAQRGIAGVGRRAMMHIRTRCLNPTPAVNSPQCRLKYMLSIRPAWLYCWFGVLPVLFWCS